MNCLASLSRSKDKKMKTEIVDNAFIATLVTVGYVLLTQFKMSDYKVKYILDKVEYCATIIIDKDEPLTREDYDNILQEEYDFVLDLNRLKMKNGTSKAILISNSAMKNSLDYILTIVAYVLFDKVGLNKKRVTTIMNRVLYYVNVGLENPDAVERLKLHLKENYDFHYEFFK